MILIKPKYGIGQLVRHKLFDYRGVVIDVDPVFSLSERWYEQVAKSRPPKDSPWYRIWVRGEQDLEEDVRSRALN